MLAQDEVIETLVKGLGNDFKLIFDINVIAIPLPKRSFFISM